MTYANNIRFFGVALGTILAFSACRDSNILPENEITEETSETLTFRVPSDGIYDWSRATGFDGFDWATLQSIDRRLYPRNFVDKGVDYEPTEITIQSELIKGPNGVGQAGSPFNSYFSLNHQTDQVHNGPYIRYEDLVELSTTSGEPAGRMEVRQEPMTEQLISKLPAANQPYPSRTVLVNNKNFKEHYANIGVTGICYYPGQDDDKVEFDLNDSRINIMNNERVAFGGEEIWNTTSGKWYWNELGPDPTINYIRFFAYAPYDKMQDSEWFKWLSPTNVATPSFAYKIPDNVNDHVDIAAKAVDAPGDYYRTVPLQFEHLLTGVRFLVDDEYMANHITKITIRGVHGEGEYRYTTSPDDVSTTTDNSLVTRGTWTTTDDSDKEFVLSRENGDFLQKAVLDELDKDGDRWSITDNEHILLMMPQQLPQGAEVIIEFDEESDQPTLVGRLDFKEVSTTPSSPSDYPDNTGGDDADGPAHTWKQGYIVTYYIQTYDIKYVLKLVKDGGLYPYAGGYDDFTVVSYAVYYTNGSKEFKKIVPVPWEPVFYDENGNTIEKPDWVNVVYDRPEKDNDEWHKGDYIEFLDNHNNLEAPTDFFEPLVLHGHVDVLAQGSMENDPHYRAMRYAEPVGTPEEPVDLSGGTDGAPGSTANCYIINAPGYYRFPLVYGNAYKNGAVNTPAFTSTQGSFMTHTNIPISSLPTPWLKTAKTIKDAALISTNAQNAVQLVKVTDDYLTIYIEPYYIDQGNTTLCVRDDEGKIMWSWHIWTTDYNPYLQSNLRRVPTTRQGESFDFMTIDLGYHYPDLNGSTTLRRVMWRPIQQCRHRGDVLIRTTPNYYHIEQQGTESTRGYAPYYNWGRKDPLLKSVHPDANKPLYTTTSAYFLTYSYRRLFDNMELTSGDFDMRRGHFYFIQPSPAESLIIPWYVPSFYNVNNPGATNNHYYIAWWGRASGRYTPVPLPPKTTETIPSWASVHGYQSNAVRMSTYYNDLWCAGQNTTVYLSGAESPRNVVKTVFDPCPPGFCVPPNRAFDYINEARALTNRHPDWDFNGKYMTYRQSEYSVGYTFYIDEEAWRTDDLSDAATINFPAHTWLSNRAFSVDDNGKPSWTLPYLSSYMNRNCSLWTADISRFSHSSNETYIGSIFNITGNFLRGTISGSLNGAGVTSQNCTTNQAVATQFLSSAAGRHVRAVKEKD